MPERNNLGNRHRTERDNSQAGASRRKPVSRTAMLAGMLCAMVLVVSQPSAVHAEDVQPWFEFGGLGHFGDSDDSTAGRAEATLFAPVYQDRSQLVFGQLDGRWFFDPSSQEGNGALGYRRVLDDHIVGGFVSYDLRNSANDNVFQQITLGAELFGAAYDARTNLYLPLTGAEDAPATADVTISDSGITLVGGQEVPLWGVDGEAGGRIASFGDGRQQLWTYLGGFYFDSWDEPIEDTIVGPQARAEYRIEEPFGLASSRLTFGFAGRWDEARDTRFEAGIRLRIALGGREGSAGASSDADLLRPRLSERIYRDPDIVLGESEAEQVQDALTGVVFDQVAHSSELFSGDLGGAVSATSENSLLIVDEDYDGEQTIDSGQNVTVASQGSVLSIIGVNSGAQLEVTLPGERRSISATANTGILNALTIGGDTNTVGAGLHLVGLDVTATHGSLEATDEATAIYVGNLTSPVILEDMTALAEATVGSGAQDAHVHGLYALGNVSGIADDPPIVAILDSRLEATLDGTFPGSASAVESLIRVYGIRAHSSQFSVEGSVLHAHSDADLTAGTGTGANTSIGLYGIRSSGGSNTTTVEDSTLLAEFSGSLTGNTGVAPPTKANALLYGLFSTDGAATADSSTLAVEFDGTMSSPAAAELYALRFGGPGSDTQALTVTDTDLSVSGSDSADWASYEITAAGLALEEDLIDTSGILFTGNRFAGTFDNVFQIATGYTFDTSSAGNIATGASSDEACADSGASWDGSFELDGVTYTMDTCTD